MPGEGFASMDTVLIQGVGPLGLLNVVKARILGAGDIIAIDKSKFRLEMAKKFGTDYIINASETTGEERIQAVKDLTKGRGPDVIVDCIGTPEIFLEGLEMLSNGGLFIEEGAYTEIGTIPISPHRHILAKSARIIGMANHPIWGYYPSMKLVQKYSKVFPFEKFVTHKYKIDDAEVAIKKSMDLDSMKVVITS